MKTVDDLISDIIAVEGGYVDHPNDKGGPTKYGITQATARAAGYKGDMREFPITMASDIYRNKYLVEPGFDKYLPLSGAIAAELFDTGVNMGPGRAAQFLQRAVNALSGSTLTVDGVLGPATLAATKAYLAKRKADGEGNLVKALNCLQGARYIEIVEGSPKQRDFINGWFANRVVI